LNKEALREDYRQERGKGFKNNRAVGWLRSGGGHSGNAESTERFLNSHRSRFQFDPLGFLWVLIT